MATILYVIASNSGKIKKIEGDFAFRESVTILCLDGGTKTDGLWDNLDTGDCYFGTDVFLNFDAACEESYRRLTQKLEHAKYTLAKIEKNISNLAAQKIKGD